MATTANTVGVKERGFETIKNGIDTCVKNIKNKTEISLKAGNSIEQAVQGAEAKTKIKAAFQQLKKDLDEYLKTLTDMKDKLDTTYAQYKTEDQATSFNFKPADNKK